MPETEHGIIYPESTDHTRLWEHFQNLAETADTAITAAVPDTGWQAWTTGVVSGYTIAVRTIGLTMWIHINGTVALPASNTVIATGFPPARAGSWQGGSADGYGALVTIGTTGSLYARATGASARANLQALYAYPIEA